MNKFTIILLIALLTITSPARSDEYRRGEVVEFVKQTKESKKSGKTEVMVWDGKKVVKVSIPTQFVRKIEEGKQFPFRIERDPKTKLFVSFGRRPL
jgi:hypothetical protein